MSRQTPSLKVPEHLCPSTTLISLNMIWVLLYFSRQNDSQEFHFTRSQGMSLFPTIDASNYRKCKEYFAKIYGLVNSTLIVHERMSVRSSPS
ncbi:hypothetical protein CDAR_611881 [Caerostris darwini]|uniref:LAGLIDADG homing endonuclease n=1 Tax=Caerostris darwini TaxID=1538125 RepID=A0AAV4MSG1_9ARAC|nr:hypothetical protein CDAR_611881 [Caerostris darwini]